MAGWRPVVSPADTGVELGPAVVERSDGSMVNGYSGAADNRDLRMWADPEGTLHAFEVSAQLALPIPGERLFRPYGAGVAAPVVAGILQVSSVGPVQPSHVCAQLGIGVWPSTRIAGGICCRPFKAP